MAKKKSKTQKAKINAKRKIKKDLVKDNIKNANQMLPAKNEDKKRLVKQDKIIYNVAITKPDLIKNAKQRNISQSKTIKKGLKPQRVIIKKTIKKQINQLQNIISKIFNIILIATFIILLTGLIKSNAFKPSIIIYISILAIFLIAIAVSYNKYTSGKVLTVCLCLTMSFFIYRLDYNYDFFNSLNTSKYETKTYYVVTFNNNINKSIYNINGKKIGLLNDNKQNIERKLDTKLDNIKYLEYTNIDELYEDFYNQKFRALVVNNNQYEYLKNNELNNKKDIKILYEFQVNALK